MKEIFITGNIYFHVFEKDGVTEKLECTQQEYQALGLQGAGRPNVAGYEDWKWIKSSSDIKYDTVDGFMKPDMFCKNPDGRIIYRNKDNEYGNITHEQMRDIVELAKIII